MGFFPGLKEIRTSIATPEKWLVDWVNGGYETNAGVAVDEFTAMNYAAFFCGINILAGTLMQTPLFLYRRDKNGGRSKATDRRLYKLLHNRVNPKMTAARWLQTMGGHILTWGNCYSQIIWGGDGEVKELRPIRPDHIRIESINGKVVKKYVPRNGEQYTFKDGELLHIPGFGFDGIQGYSLVRLARESIGMGMAVDEFGARFFGHGANMGGVFSLKGRLNPDRRKEVKEDLRKKYQGLGKSHDVLVLEEDATYTRIGIPPEDSQFLQTRKFQTLEIARWLNMPPHMLKDMEQAKFANMEQNATEFVTITMGPWYRLFETELGLQLLRQEEEDEYYFKFNADALKRGDTLTRGRSYSIGRQWGWLSANDIRELEDMDPIPNGDVYLVPLNMVPSNQLQNDMNDSQSNDDTSQIIDSNRQRAYMCLFEDRYGIIARRIVNDIKAAQEKFTEQEWKRTDEWVESYLKSENFIIKNIEPVIRAFVLETNRTEETTTRNIIEITSHVIDYIRSCLTEDNYNLNLFETLFPLEAASMTIDFCEHMG